MINRLVFALISVAGAFAAIAEPAAAQNIIGREATHRCRQPNCVRFSEEGAGHLAFVVQNATHGQNVILCGPAYTPCRVMRRGQGALPAIDVLLPPVPYTTPQPSEDDPNKDEPVGELDGAVESGEPVIRTYQVAPGALQRQNE